MPRNVRNFWIELRIDGRPSRIECGPVRKDGGFECRILMRHNGGIVEGASLWGNCDVAGNINLHFRPERAHVVRVDASDNQTTVTTKR